MIKGFAMWRSSQMTRHMAACSRPQFWSNLQYSTLLRYLTTLTRDAGDSRCTQKHCKHSFLRKICPAKNTTNMGITHFHRSNHKNGNKCKKQLKLICKIHRFWHHYSNLKSFVVKILFNVFCVTKVVFWCAHKSCKHQ